MIFRTLASVVVILALEGLVPNAPTIAQPALGPEPQIVLVEDWSTQPLGHVGIPVGWDGQSWGQPRYDFKVEERRDGGRVRKVLHLLSERDNSTVSKRVGRIDVRRYPILQWEWLAVTLPAGGDSRHTATDDQAGQLYVVFPRFPTAVRSRIIGYVWDSTAPTGSIFNSASMGMVTYVVVRSGPGDLGRWIVETRNVLDDYRRIYGAEPAEAVEVLTIGIDSNDTRSKSESYMGEILFRKLTPR